MLLREAIDLAILHHMVIRPFGPQWQVAFRLDKELKDARLADTLEEACQLIHTMRKERNEKEQGDLSW